MRIPFLTTRRERQDAFIRERAEETLKDLGFKGSDSHDVAAFLTGFLVYGTRGSAGHCPIANYLHHQGFYWVNINPTRITIFTKNYERAIARITPTEAVTDFIRDFDNGAYPLLEFLG
jgi:hypothetical protein